MINLLRLIVSMCEQCMQVVRRNIRVTRTKSVTKISTNIQIINPNVVEKQQELNILQQTSNAQVLSVEMTRLDAVQQLQLIA